MSIYLKFLNIEASYYTFLKYKSDNLKCPEQSLRSLKKFIKAWSNLKLR